MTGGLSATLDLDEFRLVRVLGQGGMGAVYLGHDTVLERDVAIKVLRRHADDEARQRFLTEARAIARLDHPNVITIFRAGTTGDGHPYIVQELIRGSSLDRMVLPIEPRRAIEIAVGIARGLAAAHRRGILHRDIKPANVMLDPSGVPKLLDFGVAKLTRREAVDAIASTTPGERRGAAPKPAGASELDQTLAAVVPAPAAQVAETLDLAPNRTVRDPQAMDATTEDVAGSGPDPGASSDHETESGVVIGTPRYMAPEIWRGELATAQSDLYSLGVLLYELVTGVPPYDQPDRLSLQTAVVSGPPARPIDEIVPGLDAELAAIISACLARDPAKRPASADEVVHRIERALVGAPPIPDGNPYPGLAPFGAEHRAVFYGRGTDISTIVDRLRGDPLVVVAGDSGIGKSSLCRAGVVPAIAAGALGGARTWRTVTIAVGRHARAALHDALGLGALGAGATPSELAAALGVTAQAGVLIFLDQFEELVTLNEPGEASGAAQILASLARGIPGVKVLIAVRGDFLTRLATLGELGPAMTRSLHILRVLSLADARDAVAGPARAKGVRFETEAVVEGLAASVADQPGSLPLLSFALSELWQRRDVDRKLIPTAALAAIGGVAGALARHADDVIGALDRAQRTAARRIALLLVTAEGTRADRDRRELCPDDDPAAAIALEAMIRGRLVVARNTATGEPSYALAHDSLIGSWSTLRGWRDDIVGQRGLRTRLAAAADEWRRLGRPRDALWNLTQLGEARVLDELSAGDRAFITASRAAARRRLVIRGAALASLPAVALVTWFAIQRDAHRTRDREVAGHVGQAARHLRDAGSARAASQRDRAEAFALFDAPQGDSTEPAEQTWARTRSEIDAAHAGYAAAKTELEAALLIDGSRRDVRAMMAQTILDHAELADADRDVRLANEIAGRLPAFDDGGGLVAIWHRPAGLVVDAPGASAIDVRRYDDHDGVQELGASLGAVEGSHLARALPPGSYQITVRGAGGVTVDDPIVLLRDEHVRLSIAVPGPGAIPPGMVLVPAGRFLAGGGTGDEIFRRSFLATAPLHPATTAAYLIGIHEVTFDDWMTYLRALPDEERERRRPHASDANFVQVLRGDGSTDDPFVFEFDAGAVRRSVRAGEPLVYAQRDRRASIRWERTPVTGISYLDARAYAAWLAATGRVRGARLCSDAEWERAARGADGRFWAHGNKLEPDDANFDVTYARAALGFGPDEVGAHPRSTSPFGLADTIGNAWEWVAGGGGKAAWRGGAWYYGAASAIAANRDPNPETTRSVTAGVRICADAP